MKVTKSFHGYSMIIEASPLPSGKRQLFNVTAKYSTNNYYPYVATVNAKNEAEAIKIALSGIDEVVEKREYKRWSGAR
jgi:hypothetical protein